MPFSVHDTFSTSPANAKRPRALMNWSGGKDAALCLHKTIEEGSYQTSSLLTTVNEHYQRVSQHGVRVELLKRQAAQINRPLRIVSMPRYPSMDTYSRLMEEALRAFKDRGITAAIYGDIMLDDLRAYREDRLAELGFSGVFPLWQQPTERLAREFIAAGFKAVVVCVNDQHLDKSFAGRDFDESFLDDLPPRVDPCGENGEFHTFDSDGPIFDRPVAVEQGELVHRAYDPPECDDADFTCGSKDLQKLQEKGFWYCDLLPVGAPSTSDVTQPKDTQSARS